MKLLPLVTAAVASSLLLVGITASADDGVLLRRSVSSAPGQTEVPEPEGEHAFTKLMNFYVPAQSADGTLKEIVYETVDGATATSLLAKPIINFYVYGPVIGFEDFSQSGFPGHGRRDAFVAVSLDDGETWKRQNVSDSADKSSFTVATPLPDPGVQQPEFEVTSDTPVTTSALFAGQGSSGRGTLTVEGTDAEPKSTVEIRNAITFEVIGTARAKKKGSFSFKLKNPDQVPCSVQAGYSDGNLWGPYAKVVGAPEDCVGPADERLITAYPGDVTNGVHAVAGNYVFAAWQSKFCSAGQPVWSDTYPRDDVAGYLGISNEVDLYLVDLMGVAGNQGSVDYREQEEFPGEYDGVGEVPYNCVWAARGVLREDPTEAGTTEVVWFTAERLTSGRRDANRIEVGCVAGAGCAVSWQEDPEGLRPGEGEGAGTGWAGATTNSKTEVWYSFIEWEDFAIADVDGTPTPVALNEFATKPQPYVPMMNAVRLSNNDRCNIPVTGTEETYCNVAVAGAYGIKDQCADITEIPLGPQGELTPICVADIDGVEGAEYPNVANTAASRPRLNLQPRDSDGDGVVDDAWVIVFAEEDKGLGRFGFPNNVEWSGNLEDVGVPCGDPDASQDDDCVEADIGKNIIWYTHALGSPDTSAGIGVDYSLIENILVQGAQLNQPEVSWRTGTFYPPMDTLDMWDFGDYNYQIFNTEIARRSSHMTQSLAKATGSSSGLIAMPLWKQGTLRQGGPADIMARRFVVDPAFDETAGNPYDVANMKCEYYDGEGGVIAGEVLFADGSNPYYPDGLCTAPAINLSGRTPFECDTGGSSLADGICPGLSLTCTDDTIYGQLCVPADTSLESQENPENIQVFDKLLSWYECPGANGANSGTRTDMPTCGSVAPGDVLGTNLDDQSWYMPLEISKAHRGFLDGDFVMHMYAWSPNYKDNKVGRDRYELYSKRSFDGGVTWTTTPNGFVASNGASYAAAGTTTCETWRDGATTPEDSHVCNTYAAGEPQQSRNMTQITTQLITTLDPRYTPTIATMTEQELGEYGAIFTYEPREPLLSAVESSDIRDPSRFFIVYENGDNTTVAVGEAEPLDLYYSRGVVFGDHMQVWAEDKPTLMIDECFPNDPHGDEKFAWAAGLGFCNEFDDLEGRRDSLSEEASITSSANGDFLYGTWGQFNVDADTGDFIDGDAMFRRVWYLDDYIPSDAWLPGQGQ